MNSQTFRGELPRPYPPAAKPLGGADEGPKRAKLAERKEYERSSPPVASRRLRSDRKLFEKIAGSPRGRPGRVRTRKLLELAQRLDVAVEAEACSPIKEGFQSDDDFDAMVALISMVAVLRCRISASTPDSADVTRTEGWILGLEKPL